MRIVVLVGPCVEKYQKCPPAAGAGKDTFNTHEHGARGMWAVSETCTGTAMYLSRHHAAVYKHHRKTARSSFPAFAEQRSSGQLCVDSWTILDVYCCTRLESLLDYGVCYLQACRRLFDAYCRLL